MCQLSYVKLPTDALSRRLLLLMSATGASVHKHGWGAMETKNEKSKYIKCSIPANCTTNYGNVISKLSGPLIGHIRLASAQVPVTDENAHPFVAKGIMQVHNGTLVPKDDKKHVTHKDVESEPDPSTGLVTLTKVKRSDSEVFFEYFMKMYEQHKTDFVKAVQEAMKEFTGKFALMYHVESTASTYIIRGKTADLYITYLKESSDEKAPVMGYAVNTSKDVLENCCLLLSNLEQLDGRHELLFSEPALLAEETIFLAKEFGLEKVGEIKENTSVYSSYSRGVIDTWEGYNDDDNLLGIQPVAKNTPINYAADNAIKYAAEIYKFMEDFSMSPKDMSRLYYQIFNASLLETDDGTMKFFTTKLMDKLRSRTTKIIRKRLKAATGGKLPSDVYITYEFPWMLNSKDKQVELVNLLERRRAAATAKG